MQNIQRKHILTHTSGKWIITSKQSHKPVISVLFGDITESSRQHYSIHLTGKLCSSRQIKVCKILYSQKQTNISVNLKKNPHTHTLSLSPLSLSFSTFDPLTVTVHVVLYFFRLSNQLLKHLYASQICNTILQFISRVISFSGYPIKTILT